MNFFYIILHHIKHFVNSVITLIPSLKVSELSVKPSSVREFHCRQKRWEISGLFFLSSKSRHCDEDQEIIAAFYYPASVWICSEYNSEKPLLENCKMGIDLVNLIVNSQF